MSEEEEPARLFLESSGSSSALRRALSAAKEDLPAPDHVEAMLARFPIPMAGPGGGGGGGGAAPIAGAAGAGTTIKIIGGLAIATMIGGGTYLATRSDPTAPSARAPAVTITATMTATVATAAPSIPESAPTLAMTESASATHSVKVAKPATAASGDPPRPEMDILKEARAAAQSNPSRALQLVNEHANGYPKSSMAQEREMIRIQALLNQGKRAEAKALADAFKKAHPNSAYSQRLDSMF